MLDDKEDNIIGKVTRLFFSKEGEYSFYLSDDVFTYYITNEDTIKIVRASSSPSGIYGKFGEIKTIYFTPDSFYYANVNPVILYSKGFGKIVQHMTDFTKNNIALTTEKGDSVYYFRNGELMARNHKTNLDVFPGTEKWTSFSRNGNAISWFYNNGKSYVQLNSTILDSNDRRFIQLETNDKGDYFYGIGKKGIPNTNFDYMFFPVYNGIRYDSVRTIWSSYLRQDGGFYCTGANPYYLLVNGKYYNKTEYENLILPDSINFFFTETIQDGGTKKTAYHTANQNGIIKFSTDRWRAMDRNGNYTLLQNVGSNYQILTNGIVKDIKPIGVPIAVDAAGNIISYEIAKKQTKIYRNDDLILQQKGTIKIFDQDQFLYSFFSTYTPNNIPAFENTFNYLEIGNYGYIIWNGILSSPLKKPLAKSSGEEYPKIGELLAGGIEEDGFYLFQYNGNKKINLLLNNKSIDLGNEIDQLMTNSIYLEKNKLTFYAICKNKVKRFEVKL